MSESAALVPIEERAIDFYGDSITALLVPGESQPEIYIALRPLCDYLGLSWSGQYERIKRDPVLNEALQFVRLTRTNPAGGNPTTLCLPLEFLPGWLFGISVARVRPEMQEKITRYRRECFRVLWRAFQADALSALGVPEVSPTAPAAGSTALAQIRELGLAVAQMAEQQLIAEQRLAAHDTRLDRAASVIKVVQSRLDALEERVAPAAFISDAQAAELTMLVRAVAQTLTTHDSTKNHYQGVFAELYRRFQVTSYKLVRQEQFPAVIAFLQEWQATLSTTPSRLDTDDA